jgi:adenylate cyclase class 2
MQQEVEAKFLDIDHAEIRAKLEQLGAVLEHPNRLMRRTIFDFPDRRLKQQKSRLRVRDEGGKITITYKSASDTQYSNEVETTVGSYETMVDLLRALGLNAYATQESKRETWRCKNVEIELDEWPWAPQYVEIEGPDEAAIKQVTAELGLDWTNAVFESADAVYHHHYPGMRQEESIGAVAELTFAGDRPQWLQERM